MFTLHLLLILASVIYIAHSLVLTTVCLPLKGESFRNIIQMSSKFNSEALPKTLLPKMKTFAGLLIAGSLTASPPVAWGQSNTNQPMEGKFTSIKTPNGVLFDISDADKNARIKFECSNDLQTVSTATVLSKVFTAPRSVQRKSNETKKQKTCVTKGINVIFQDPYDSVKKKEFLINQDTPGSWIIVQDTNSGVWTIGPRVK